MTPPKTSIKLANGKFFDFLHPEDAEIDIETVAHHLATGAIRYAGALSTPLSVAQHSVLVDEIVMHLAKASNLHSSDLEEYFRLRLDAIMHDAPESVMGDMVYPLKILCPDFRAHEIRIDAAFANKFGYRTDMPPMVKRADLIARYVETKNFDRYFDPNTSIALGEQIPELFKNYHLPILSWSEAKIQFLERYAAITRHLNRLAA